MSHTDIHTDVLTATVTNLAYLVAGWIIVQMGNDLLVVGSLTMVHCFLSGWHHLVLTKGSRLADFGGMYAVGIALFLAGFNLPVPVQAGIAIIFALLLIGTVGVSRIVVGIVIGLAAVMVGIKAGVFAAFVVVVLMGNALTFNYIADNALRGHHSMIHGLPWHTQTALSIAIAAALIGGVIEMPI